MSNRQPPPARQFAELDERNDRALGGGGEDGIEKQHAAGKQTARERIDLLLDPGSFVELDRFVTHRCADFGMQEQKVLGDGVVTGHGKVAGRRVFVFAQDFTVFAGSVGAAHASKICKLMDLAMKTGAPVVGLYDSGGARIQEGVMALAGHAEIVLRNTLASGVIPQISAIMGPCAGGAAFAPAITDFILMVEDTSYLFITGPDVVRRVTDENVSRETLGGAAAHASRSGVAHLTAPHDRASIAQIRELLGFLPSNNTECPPIQATDDPVDRECSELDGIIPEEGDQPYDIRKVITAVVDDGRLFELHEQYAKNVVVGFARIGGRPVGIVANQPAYLAGVLDVDGSVKAARFVRFCDCFNIPIVTWVDVPGFLPGVEQEHRGIAAHGAKLLYAFCEATVPKLTVITRKAYGGAYGVMGSRHVRGDVCLSFPTAEIAVIAPEGAVNVVQRNAIEEAANPEDARARFIAEYRSRFASPYEAAELGFVDEVIYPRECRKRLATYLDLLRTKRDVNPPKKHGNIPL